MTTGRGISQHQSNHAYIFVASKSGIWCSHQRYRRMSRNIGNCYRRLWHHHAKFVRWHEVAPVNISAQFFCFPVYFVHAQCDVICFRILYAMEMCFSSHVHWFWTPKNMRFCFLMKCVFPLTQKASFSRRAPLQHSELRAPFCLRGDWSWIPPLHCFSVLSISLHICNVYKVLGIAVCEVKRSRSKSQYL